MCYKVIIVACFLEILTLSLYSAEDLDEKIVKHADIDLQTCINNFDIHRDKIIRTQDSRDMGAKYLNEIDLGSREECLRLCCETENCDVFVYEEKNSGSCYLFYCGPPEDFKCKFTHHVNYSSAVLAINRHLPDLESQIKLTKHEQDLSKLRKPDMEVKPPVPSILTTPSTTTTTFKTKEELPIIAETKPPEQTRKCSRYQFECRSTGECIAIYNACDGIPQCADGSDEAPELGCPEMITTSLPMPVPANNPTINPVFNQNIPPVQVQPQVPNAAPPQQVYQPPAVQEAINPRIPVSRPEADFLRPVIPESRNPAISHGVGYESQQQIPQYVPVAPQSDTGWIPHQSNQMPRPMYVDKNSHIFNHKENGLQVPNGQETRYNKYKGAMQVLHRALGYSSGGQVQYADTNAAPEYQKIPNYYGEMYRPQLSARVEENWPAANQRDEVRYSSNTGLNNNLNPSTNRFAGDGISRGWHQQQIPESDTVPVNYIEQPQIQIANYNKEKENPKHIQDKMAQDLKQSKKHMEDGINNKDTNVRSTTEKQVQVLHSPDIPNSMAYISNADSLDLQDGTAETPSGAILSLTLGLIITFFTALLIGCRLRVVRKRMRKCGKSFAHDADYLVNGMYL